MRIIKKGTGLWILSAGVLLIAFMFFSIYFPISDNDKPAIVLPGTAGNDIGIEIVPIGKNNKIVEAISINADNVQEVVKTLERPTEYSFEAKSQLFYATGSSTSTIAFARKGDLERTEQYSNYREVKISILSPPNIYIWNKENRVVYKGLAGDFTGDDMALMPTYEKVAEYPKKDILSAKIGDVDGNSCIIVEFLNELTNVKEIFYISIDNGLLLMSESYEDDLPVYKYKLTAFSLEPLAEDTFDIPGA